MPRSPRPSPSVHTLKPCSAFVCREQGFDYIDIPSDWWMITWADEETCARAGHVGSLLINGTDCAVFVDDYDGTHYAQPKTTTRDGRRR